MSQRYKFKSLQIADMAKQKEKTREKGQSDGITIFEIGDTKTINFILMDGTQQNFAYSHYLTAWLGKEGKERVIKVFFATHLVTIRGYCLDEVYKATLSQSLKMVTAHDERYLKDVSEGEPFVKDIKITWKKDKDLKEDND